MSDPEAEVRAIIEQVEGIQDPQERIERALQEMESRSRRPLPEIERFPIHFYEDGIEGFQLALRLRQIVALKHWQGDTGYTMFDAIQLMVGAIR